MYSCPGLHPVTAQAPSLFWTSICAFVGNWLQVGTTPTHRPGAKEFRLEKRSPESSEINSNDQIRLEIVRSNSVWHAHTTPSCCSFSAVSGRRSSGTSCTPSSLKRSLSRRQTADSWYCARCDPKDCSDNVDVLQRNNLDGQKESLHDSRLSCPWVSEAASRAWLCWTWSSFSKLGKKKASKHSWKTNLTDLVLESKAGSCSLTWGSDMCAWLMLRGEVVVALDQPPGQLTWETAQNILKQAPWNASP